MLWKVATGSSLVTGPFQSASCSPHKQKRPDPKKDHGR